MAAQSKVQSPAKRRRPLSSFARLDSRSLNSTEVQAGDGSLGTKSVRVAEPAQAAIRSPGRRFGAYAETTIGHG
jgi:hypothetical protein